MTGDPCIWGFNLVLLRTLRLSGEHRCVYLTERVKSPGLLLLGRARKLPWTPRVNRSCSASIPVMLGWNHLNICAQRNGKKQMTNQCIYNSHTYSSILHQKRWWTCSALPPLVYRPVIYSGHNGRTVKLAFAYNSLYNTVQKLLINSAMFFWLFSAIMTLVD